MRQGLVDIAPLSVMRIGLLLQFEGWDRRYGNVESREGGSDLSRVHWSKGTPGQRGQVPASAEGPPCPCRHPA